MNCVVSPGPLLGSMPSRTRDAMIGLLLLVLVPISQVSAQDLLEDSSQLAFEVASLRPYKASSSNFSIQVGWCHGIDSTFAARNLPITPPGLGRCDFINLTLRDLIWNAYFSESKIRLAKQLSAVPIGSERIALKFVRRRTILKTRLN